MPVPEKCNPDLSDDQHYDVISTHEAGHMVTGMAMGFTPLGTWITRDRTAEKGGQASLNCTGLGQHVATWLKAGAVAQERALRDLGFDEAINPRLFQECRGSQMSGDNAAIEDMRVNFPQMHLDGERATRDAGLLLASPRLWTATRELAADLKENLSLTPERILEILAPYRVESAIREEGITLWSEVELQDVHSDQAPTSEQTGSAILDRPRSRTLTDAMRTASPPRPRPDQRTPTAQPRTPRRAAH